jgi:hypothetical protein
MVLALGAGSYSLAQMPVDNVSNADTPQPMMPENELENLVAPIALYPDALLSQVLVASTYPLEVVEAQRWLQQNRYLQGRELMEAAQQQNWDPSVQALVAFPDVVERLNRSMDWTTELGNAFLAQQADVMNAIQNLRAEARESGQLESTPQLAVSTETQGDQSAIDIQPADPQRMYVPNYDPYAVWGRPAEGDYPSMPYAQGSGFGTLFGTVANLAGFLPGFGGLLGPKSWGWALSWLAQALFVNNSFFNDFGFHNYDGGFRGSSVWVHNAHHRLGVPYGNRSVASGYGRGVGSRQGEGWRGFGNGSPVSSGSEGRRSFAPYRASAGQSYSRIERRPGRPAPPVTERTASASQSGRTFSQGAHPDRLQTNRGVGRADYFANSGQSRGRSFTDSRSFASGSNYNGLGNQGRRVEPSRSANRSWEGAPRISAARGAAERESSFGRGTSSRGSSSRGSSPRGSVSRGSSSHGSWWKHGFSSHSSRPKAPKAPKAPHYAKSHGGGHSSGGHSGKRSHRG